MQRHFHILVVEDDSNDVIMIREAIRGADLRASVHVVKDGERAAMFFDEAERDPSAPAPDLILLDINLPKRSGQEVLAQMRHGSRCRDTLVVVVSGQDASAVRQQLMTLGATAFFRKPDQYDEYMKLGPMLKHLLESVTKPSALFVDGENSRAAAADPQLDL